MIFKNQKRIIFLILIVLSLLMLIGSVSAKDVPINTANNFKSTIEGSGVASGDTVSLTNPSSPGYFNLSGNTNISINKNVTIRSANTAQKAILDLSSNGRAFIVANNGVLTLTDLTIRNGLISDSSGGAIYIYSGGRVILNGCNFSNNRIENAYPSSLVMDYGYGGGAIYNAGNLTISNCNFTYNSATGVFTTIGSSVLGKYVYGGGAIWNSGGNLNISNSILNNNTVNRCRDGGAAIYMMNGGIVNVDRCNFTNNLAINYTVSGIYEVFNGQYESAIYRYSGTFNVSNCNFILNNLPGVPIMGTVTISGNNYYISNSTSSIKNALSKVSNGDTIYLNPGTYNGTSNWNITINKNVTIRGNGSASNVIIDGKYLNGTIFNITAGYKLTLIDLTITGGNGTWGGAIYNRGVINATNCIFRNNTANNAGVIYNPNGVATFTGCNFTNNNASIGGGAVYNDGVNGAMTLTNCNFINNRCTASTGGGGAVFISSGRATLTGCNFTNNSATSNGGAIRNGANLTVYGCTFMNNSATSGAAIYNYDLNGGNLNVSFSVFFNNTGSSYHIYRNSGNVVLNDNFYFWVINNISDTTYINSLKNNITNYPSAIGSFYYISISGYNANYGVSQTATITSTLARNGMGTGNPANLPNIGNNYINIRYGSILNTNYNYKSTYSYTIPTTSVSSGNTLQFSFGNILLRQLPVTINKGTTNLAVNNVIATSVGEPIQVTATLTAYGKAINGVSVGFYVNGLLRNTINTDANGRAVFTYTPTPSDPQSSNYQVTYGETTNYLGSSSSIVSFTISSFNYTSISSEIDVASTIVDSSKYTTASWAKFQAALNKAKDLLKYRDGLSQAEIDACLKALADARKGLVAVNYNAISTEIVVASTLIKSDYTAASWTKFQTALTNAKTMYNNRAANSQAEIDVSLKALADARKNLVRAGTTNTGVLTKKNVDLKITKVKRSKNTYKVTIKNLGKEKSDKTKVKIWYKFGGKTFKKTANVRAIKAGKSLVVKVKFFKYAKHYNIKKTVQVNFNKLAYETNYKNNKFTIKKE